MRLVLHSRRTEKLKKETRLVIHQATTFWWTHRAGEFSHGCGQLLKLFPFDGFQASLHSNFGFHMRAARLGVFKSQFEALYFFVTFVKLACEKKHWHEYMKTVDYETTRMNALLQKKRFRVCLGRSAVELLKGDMPTSEGWQTRERKVT